MFTELVDTQFERAQPVISTGIYPHLQPYWLNQNIETPVGNKVPQFIAAYLIHAAALVEHLSFYTPTVTVYIHFRKLDRRPAAAVKPAMPYHPIYFRLLGLNILFSIYIYDMHHQKMPCISADGSCNCNVVEQAAYKTSKRFYLNLTYWTWYLVLLTLTMDFIMDTDAMIPLYLAWI